MSFFHPVAGLTLKDKVGSSDIRMELGVQLLLLCTEGSRLRWFRHLIWFSRHIQLVGDPRVDCTHAAEIIYLIWLGNAPRSPPRRSWKMLLGRGRSVLPCLACCHHECAPDKRQKTDGWKIQIHVFFASDLSLSLLILNACHYQVWSDISLHV